MRLIPLILVTSALAGSSATAADFRLIAVRN
jgi:hypothetical protein